MLVRGIHDLLKRVDLILVKNATAVAVWARILCKVGIAHFHPKPHVTLLIRVRQSKPVHPPVVVWIYAY